MLTYYGYKNCDTCRKAQKALKAAAVDFDDRDITTDPPSRSVLAAALKSGYAIRDLFNKSGVLYREMKMKDKIKVTPEAELLDLLAANGKLIKRPIVTDSKRFTVGYKEDAFAAAWCQ
jgi:arsenate reductase